jgi:hypothetical protein
MQGRHPGNGGLLLSFSYAYNLPLEKDWEEAGRTCTMAIRRFQAMWRPTSLAGFRWLDDLKSTSIAVLFSMLGRFCPMYTIGSRQETEAPTPLLLHYCM